MGILETAPSVKNINQSIIELFLETAPRVKKINKSIIGLFLETAPRVKKNKSIHYRIIACAELLLEQDYTRGLCKII